MKRVAVVLAVVLLLAAVLMGCVSSPGENPSGEEIEHIVMTYQTMSGGNTAGLDEVREAINEISREAIGVEVEFRLVDALEAPTEYPVWLSQRENVDLMVLNYLDITSYVSPGYLAPLDDLLAQYGQGILELQEQGEDVIGGAVVGGQIYGVDPVSATRGSGGGLWIPARYLQETGFACDPDQICTLEDLDALFAKLKELYPDSYPFGQITTDRTFSSYSFLYGSDRWLAAADSADSGVMAPGSGVFQNFYETEDYQEFLSWLHRWYQAGYIYPDAAVTTLASTELLKNGTILSIPSSSSPGMFTEENAGEEIAYLMTSPVVYGPNNSSTGIRWVIPAESEKQAAAMKFLNLMFTDQRIVNLFMWGVEGRDYVVADPENGLIAYPDGKRQADLAYQNPLGMYGNMTLRYELEGDALQQAQADYSAKAVPIGMEYAGFTFDNSALIGEREMVRQVLHRYLPVLESGSVDLDTVYPAFIADLKAAGMDKIIAEKQRQLDLFLAEK